MKMNDEELQSWLEANYLPEAGVEKLKAIRQSPPVRNVDAGANNVPGAYCVKKMGVTIQAESHTVERPFLHEYEYDPDVREIYDQPCKIPLRYEAFSGRLTGVVHTPDYFVIRQSCAGFEEHKTETDLIKLSEKMPNRYMQDENGQWRCPPGENYARQFGFYYRVRSDSEINWCFTRNADYLYEFYKEDTGSIDHNVRDSIVHIVRENEGIRLVDLKDACDGNVDAILMMIANNLLFVDLYRYELPNDKSVPVFTSEIIAEAYEKSKPNQAPKTLTHSSLQAREGQFILLDGVSWKVFQAGETTVVLQSKTDIKYLRYEEIAELFREGLISGLDEDPVEQDPRIKSASPSALQEALDRARIAEQYLKDGTYPKHICSKRTAQRYAKAYREAEEANGSGFAGVIPMSSQRGNRNPKLAESVQIELNMFIATKYEDKRARKPAAAYLDLKAQCDAKGYDCPSYKTFVKNIRQRPRQIQERKRFGKRVAYKYQPFYWELTPKTPRHGDYPFHICHIDHTKLDIELISSRTGKSLGRPWATYLIDSFTRTILAVYLTYFPPSRTSCMMVMRECVRRHYRLPRVIITDGGREFTSSYYCTFLAQYNIDRKKRPPAKGRFGSVCERLFGTTNTEYVHNLIGNTKITRNVRQVTKSVNPKNLAIWTIEEFDECLKEWAYNVYDNEQHPALGMSPREARAAGAKNHGPREISFIKYDRDFEISTLPTTRSGKAKVQPGQGFKLNYYYYRNELLHRPKVEGQTIPIRYDPLNIAKAYAFVEGQWIDCENQYYLELQNFTVKELAAASEELRKQNKLTGGHSLNSLQLVEFMTKVERKEQDLENQKLALKQKGFDVIEGGKAKESASNYETKVAVVIDPAKLETYGEY